MSRRSSTSTIGEAASISLEYDDYPLDLVATTDDIPVEDLPLDLDDFHLDLIGEGQPTESAPMLSSTWRSSPHPWTTQMLVQSQQQPQQQKQQQQQQHQQQDVKVPLRKFKHKDTILSEEIITDYGRRSWCDYEVRACPDTEDVFVASEKRLSQLISQTAQHTVDQQLMYINEQLVEQSETPQNKSKLIFKERIKQYCTNCKRYFLVKYNALPSEASRCQKVRHAFLCPPHGLLAHYMTLLLGTVLLWILLWAIMGHLAINGPAATLFLLYISGYIGAKLTVFVRLPSYLGTLLSGLVLGNCLPNDWISPVPGNITNMIRHMFLALTLLYVSLFTRVSKRLLLPVVRLALIPAAMSVATGCVASYFLQAMPWKWALAAGLLVSCTCPVHLGKQMHVLQAAGHGLDDHIPRLTAMAGGLQAAVITCFTVIVLSINSMEGWWLLLAIQIPLEAVLGCIVGLVLSCFLVYLPNKKAVNHTTIRMLLFLVAAVTVMETAVVTGHSVIGPPACLILGAIMAGSDLNKAKLEVSVSKLYNILEPLVFSLLGFCINAHELYANDIGAAFGVVLLSSCARFFMSYLSILGLGLSIKDKIFIPIALLPAASIQISTLAVAIIVILSPMGGRFRTAMGKHLLPVSKLYYEGFQQQPMIMKQETATEGETKEDNPEVTTEMEATV